jgi:hypothetical protein
MALVILSAAYLQVSTIQKLYSIPRWISLALVCSCTLPPRSCLFVGVGQIDLRTSNLWVMSQIPDA